MQTRSGLIHMTGVKSSNLTVDVSAPSNSVRRSPRFKTASATSRPQFFEPNTVSNVVERRSPRLAKRYIPADIMRELREEVDYDSTSDYEEEEEFEPSTQYKYQSDATILAPKYEVRIDFDEASSAWRANKRRVGESWVYKTATKRRLSTTTADSSIGNRIKSLRRTAAM